MEKPIEIFDECAKMVGGLPPKIIDKLAMIAIATTSNDYKIKTIVEFLGIIPPEKVQEFISICLNKTIDEALPEIVALLGTQPTTEVEEPTIKF